jgi:hypothetical protein
VWRYGSCWHRASYQGRLPLGFQPTTVSTRAMLKMQQRRISGPIPKFASSRVTFRCELRNLRTTSNFMILVRF